MITMLPAVAASAFAAVGLTGSSVVGRELAAVAEPLFVVSAVLLMIGALACSRLATGLAASGSICAFVGMFVLTNGATMRGMGSLGATSSTGEALFYLGAALIAASFATTALRRHRRSCAPVVAALGR
jgi:hypothetical protein